MKFYLDMVCSIVVLVLSLAFVVIRGHTTNKRIMLFLYDYLPQTSGGIFGLTLVIVAGILGTIVACELSDG